MARSLALGVVALMLCMTVAWAQKVDENRVSSPEGFAITLENGWTVVDQNTLAEFSQFLRESMKGRIPDYCMALQYGDASDLTIPYVLVAPLKSGWLDDKDFERRKSEFVLGVKKGRDQVAKDNPDTPAIDIDEPFFDATHKIIWTTLTIEDPEVGPIQCLQGCKLTSYGMLSFACFGSDLGGPDLEEGFRRMVTTVEISPEFDHKKGPPSNKGFLGGAIGGLVGGLYALYASRKKKQIQTTPTAVSASDLPPPGA